MILFPKHDSSAAYDFVDEESFSEKDSLQGLIAPRSPIMGLRALCNRTTFPWLISGFFCFLSMYLLTKDFRRIQAGSYESGYSNELRAGRHLIQIEEKRFSGSPGFFENGTEYIVKKKGAPMYVGEPSEAIDSAWNALTHGRYFLLTEEEAKEAWGDEYKEFWDEYHGGYTTGLEMMHTLHCLNHIRMAFYPDYYPMPPIHGYVHREHCIDQLRQMIMCKGDLTPIPTRWRVGVHQNYIDTNRLHTCRNWDKVREWVTERYDGKLAVPRNPRGYP